MAEGPQAPGPGRSTSEAALKALKKDVAARNEAAQKEATKKRAPYEERKLREKRRMELL